MRLSVLRAGALCVTAAFLLGCATQAGQLFPPVKEPLEWPGAGAEPRIRYEGQISSQADLKAPRSGWQKFTEAISGQKPPARMESPLDVTLVGENRLYVADPAAGCVHLFDLESREYRRFGSESGISRPVAIAADAQELLVVDAGTARVLRLGADGKLLGVVGAGQIDRPAGVCVSPTDRSILVADAGSHQILRFSPNGELLGRIGSRGTQPGEFNFPTYLECDGDGRIYVSDSLNFRVQILDPGGKVLGVIGSLGNRPGNLSLPKGVAVDSDGHVYVVDARFENVQIFEPSGQVLLPFGKEGTRPGEFWLPAGIHIDKQDRIWVADSYNHRVQVFRYLRERQAGTLEQGRSSTGPSGGNGPGPGTGK
jgi:DNA-binding beta-propeller fold protein YncE